MPLRFAAALLSSAAACRRVERSFCAQAPQHTIGAGFLRQTSRRLEVTPYSMAHGVFDPHCAETTKATMDGVVEALHEDPRLWMLSDEGFLRQHWQELILVALRVPAPGGGGGDRAFA